MKNLRFKMKKNKVKLVKNDIFSKKEIKYLNSLLEKISYKKYLEEMGAYIDNIGEDYFEISLITYDMLIDTIITETVSVDSRFSTISGKENIRGF